MSSSRRPCALTSKQQRFVEENLIDLNGTQAAIRARYAPKAAKVTASRLLASTNVQTALTKALTRRSERAAITADSVLREYARLAFADITNVVAVVGHTVTVKDLDELPQDVTAAIVEVAQTKDGIRLKFHSETQALDALARHLGVSRQDGRARAARPEPPAAGGAARAGANRGGPGRAEGVGGAG